MDKGKSIDEQKQEEIKENRKSILTWIKEHKNQLILAGVSVTALMATVLGVKNKEALADLGNLIKENIEKGTPFSGKWLKKASLDELKDARELVQKDYLNPELDMDYRSKCWDLLSRFDNAIGKKEWAGKEYGYPVHSEHGWYLSSDD